MSISLLNLETINCFNQINSGKSHSKENVSWLLVVSLAFIATGANPIKLIMIEKIFTNLSKAWQNAWIENKVYFDLTLGDIYSYEINEHFLLITVIMPSLVDVTEYNIKIRDILFWRTLKTTTRIECCIFWPALGCCALQTLVVISFTLTFACLARFWC